MLDRTGSVQTTEILLRSPFAVRSIDVVTLVSAGPPSGGLYLKPPSSGGLCEGVMTIPSARPLLRFLIVGQDRMRNDRRRRVSIAIIDHRGYVIGRKYLERASYGGSDSAWVSIPMNSGPLMPFAFGMTDRLADRQDMRLVEGAIEGGSTMA